MSLPPARQLYARFEDMATPIADRVVHSTEFATAFSTWTRVNRRVRRRLQGVAAHGWHALNLPAGTDVQRLKTQLGALDREVRRLAVELERNGREVGPDGETADDERGRSTPS